MPKNKAQRDFLLLHDRWFKQDGITLFLDSLDAHTKSNIETFSDSLLPFSCDGSAVCFTKSELAFMRHTLIGELRYDYVKATDEREALLILRADGSVGGTLVLSAREGRAYEIRGRNLEEKLKEVARHKPNLSLYVAIEKLIKGNYSESLFFKQHLERLETLSLEDLMPNDIKKRAAERAYRDFIGDLGDRLIAEERCRPNEKKGYIAGLLFFKNKTSNTQADEEQNACVLQ